MGKRGSKGRKRKERKMTARKESKGKNIGDKLGKDV